VLETGKYGLALKQKTKKQYCIPLKELRLSIRCRLETMQFETPLSYLTIMSATKIAKLWHPRIYFRHMASLKFMGPEKLLYYFSHYS